MSNQALSKNQRSLLIWLQHAIQWDAIPSARLSPYIWKDGRIHGKMDLNTLAALERKGMVTDIERLGSVSDSCRLTPAGQPYARCVTLTEYDNRELTATVSDWETRVSVSVHGDSLAIISGGEYCRAEAVGAKLIELGFMVTHIQRIKQSTDPESGRCITKEIETISRS